MPELPEVESLCRVMRRVLEGRPIRGAWVANDEIVLRKRAPEEIASQLTGNTVTGVGRVGKYWWLELERGPCLLGHLGMSGWIEEMRSDDEDPRFLKLKITTEVGLGVAFTDGRRLGRIWLAETPTQDPQIRKLGPDALEQLPTKAALLREFRARKTPIKALLLDQSFIAGIGNYLADEVLYQSRISPKRLPSTLSESEVSRLRLAIKTVVAHAIDVGADSDRFPDTWMFHHRWGGNRGSESIKGKRIVRETVGGRTTAWVPEVQR